MTDTAQQIVHRALAKARSHAANQALGLIGLTLSIVGYNVLAPSRFAWWEIAIIVLNTWVTYVMGRRWLWLRKVGPVVLSTPAEVAAIRGVPPKLPDNVLPMFLEIHIKNGAKCSLLLDRKNPQAIAALVGALRERSPDAIVAVPNLDIAEGIARGSRIG